MLGRGAGVTQPSVPTLNQCHGHGRSFIWPEGFSPTCRTVGVVTACVSTSDGKLDEELLDEVSKSIATGR